MRTLGPPTIPQKSSRKNWGYCYEVIQTQYSRHTANSKDPQISRVNICSDWDQKCISILVCIFGKYVKIGGLVYSTHSFGTKKMLKSGAFCILTHPRKQRAVNESKFYICKFVYTRTNVKNTISMVNKTNWFITQFRNAQICIRRV